MRVLHDDEATETGTYPNRWIHMIPFGANACLGSSVPTTESSLSLSADLDAGELL
jgi:hypothetical protein